MSAAQTRAVREGMRGVIGLSGSGRVTSRGETRSSTINIPDSTPTEVREVLQQLTDQFGTLTVPLPVEPVAPGATWTARSDVVCCLGARVKLQTDYRLVQIDGDRIRLQIDQHQTAAPQTFRLPTLSAARDPGRQLGRPVHRRRHPRHEPAAPGYDVRQHGHPDVRHHREQGEAPDPASGSAGHHRGHGQVRLSVEDSGRAGRSWRPVDRLVAVERARPVLDVRSPPSVWPPSTPRHWPVTQDDSGPAR